MHYGPVRYRQHRHAGTRHRGGAKWRPASCCRFDFCVPKQVKVMRYKSNPTKILKNRERYASTQSSEGTSIASLPNEVRVLSGLSQRGHVSRLSWDRHPNQLHFIILSFSSAPASSKNEWPTRQAFTTMLLMRNLPLRHSAGRCWRFTRK